MSRLALALTQLLFTTWCLAGQCPSPNDRWKDFAPGACRLESTIASDGQQYQVRGFRLDPAVYEVELVDPIRFFEKQNRSGDLGANAQTRPLSQEFVFSAEEVLKYAQVPGTVVSPIGYPRFAGDPLLRGLLRVDGATLTPLADSETERAYLTTILCFDKRDSPRGIGKVSAPVIYANLQQWTDSNCENALQVGPRIIEKWGERGIRKRLDQKDNRTTLSIGRDNHFYLLYWTAIALYDVQQALVGRKLGPDASPKWAVNVSLREFSGILTTDWNVGEIETTNAAFLIFRPRTRSSHGAIE